MGSAIIEGFFGVELDGQGLTLQPRLGLNDGFIRVYQAATDRYAAYSYDWDQNVTRLDYGTNAADPVVIKVLKLRSEQIRGVMLDGRPVEFETEASGHDVYTVFSVPSGQHSIEIVKGQPLVQPASVEVAPPDQPASTPGPTPPSNAPNLASPPEIEGASPAEASPTEPAAVEPGLNPAEAQPAGPAASSISPISEKTRQNRNAFFRFIGASLAILISLLLMVLVALRRATGF
jgi:hypothetical protein